MRISYDNAERNWVNKSDMVGCEAEPSGVRKPAQSIVTAPEAAGNFARASVVS